MLIELLVLVKESNEQTCPGKVNRLWSDKQMRTLLIFFASRVVEKGSRC